MAKPASPRRRWLRWLGWSALALFLAGGLGLTILWSVMSREADSYLTIFALRVPKTITKVLDQDGNIIGVFAEEHRVVIPYGDIPKAFVNALISTEDADFWSHSGITMRGFARSGWTYVSSFGRRKEGASTLTMQLVRTVTNRRERRLLAGGVKRKLNEIILARKLEKAYTKKQILEMYANEVYFGGGRYGIEAAAQFYFGKSAPQLNVEECALIAGLVQNPNWYNPYNPDPKARAAAKARRNHVLVRMAKEGFLKPKEAELLLEKPIRLARENAREAEIAPYAVEEVRKYLYEKYGREAVLNGGLEVTTTLDSTWQEAANEAVRNGLKAVDRRRGFRKDNVQFVENPDEAKLPGWNHYFEPGDMVRGLILGWSGGKARVRIGKAELQVPESAFAWAGKEALKVLVRGAAPWFSVKKSVDGVPSELELDQEPSVEGALLAVDPLTGEVRAMVGGWDYNRSKYNRAWQAERQVGSTMKAFVYGAAFERGLTPMTLVQDVPTRFLDPVDFMEITKADGTKDYKPLRRDAKPYEPKNYERDFWGPIPIWEALRDSRNVPAVRTLDEAGVANVIDFARKAGVSGRIPPYPSMALGSADLYLKDMVRAYATLANQGVQSPAPFLIRKIVDRNGKVLERHDPQPGEQVLDRQTCFQVIQCLQGVAQRGTGARSNELQWPLAGKTGTTDDHTDAWFVGFSTKITCGVWVGLDEKKTIFRGADGAKVALPIWMDFMRTALPTTGEKEDFKAPEGMEWADVDRYTGLLASSVTTPENQLHLAFKPGTLPKSGSDAETTQQVREARAKAASQPQEVRVFGRPTGLPTAEEKQPDLHATDPNAN